MTDSTWERWAQGRRTFKSAVIGLHEDVETGRIAMDQIAEYSCSDQLAALLTPESARDFAKELFVRSAETPAGDNSFVLLIAIIGDLASVLCQSGSWAKAEPLVALVEACWARHRKNWLIETIISFANELDQAGLHAVAFAKYREAELLWDQYPHSVDRRAFSRRKATIQSKTGQFREAAQIAMESDHLDLGIAILVDAVAQSQLSLAEANQSIRAMTDATTISSESVVLLATLLQELIHNSDGPDPMLIRYLALSHTFAEHAVERTEQSAFEMLFQAIEAGFCHKADLQTLSVFHLEWAKKLFRNGHFMKSLQWTGQVIEELAKAPDPELLTETIVLQGCLFDQLGQYENALESFDEAEATLVSCDDPQTLARIYLNRGGTLLHLERYGESIDAFAAAEQIYLEHEQIESVLRCQINQAIALKHLKKYEQALEIFQRKSAELLQAEMVREYATIQNYLIEIHVEQANYSQAIETFSKMDQTCMSDQELASLMASLSESFYKTGQPEQGRLYFQKAVEYREKARQKAGIDLTSLEYVGLRQGFYEKGIRIALESDQVASAYESLMVAKASLLDDMQSHRSRTIMPEPEFAFKARKELGEWLTDRGRNAIAGDENLHQPETMARMKNYMNAFRASTSGTPRFDEPYAHRTTVKQIQDSLADGWGILDFWRVDANTVAIFLLTPSSFQMTKLNVPFETHAFRSNLIRFGRCIDASAPVASDEILDDLYHYLFEPIMPLLKGLTGLYLIPHERLHYLPIHACRRYVNGRSRYLNDDFEIAYLPSSRILPHLPTLDLDGEILSLANPDLGTPKTLPFADWESRWIGERFPSLSGDFYRGAKANFASVQGWSKASILHFSCHGSSEYRRVAFSRLHLADDVLMAHDLLYRLERLKHGSLVILNGCQTATLDDRSLNESMGLATAFLMRGAGLALSTSWSVDDCSAAEFVTTFLKEILQNRLSPTLAMRKAQAHVRGLASEKLALREQQLLRLFPARDFPFEAASIHRRAAWRLLRSGQPDEALEQGRLAAEALRLTGDTATASAMLDGLKTSILSQSAPDFDHPIYWSAFRLIGRVH
ncbi:MAG: CHAT domain-containing protein [Planctomycetota bacterium]|nr:CHAT domain-containing protein [Planctomycetota bacterium]